jgi:hypothetical protein
MEDQVLGLWKRTFPFIAIEKGTGDHEIVLTIVSQL